MPSIGSQSSMRNTTGLGTQITLAACLWLTSPTTAPFYLYPKLLFHSGSRAHVLGLLRPRSFQVSYLCHGSLDARRGQLLCKGPESHPSCPCFVASPNLLSDCPCLPFLIYGLACSFTVLHPRGHHSAMLHLASLSYLTLQVGGQKLRLGSGVGLGLWSFRENP